MKIQEIPLEKKSLFCAILYLGSFKTFIAR